MAGGLMYDDRFLKHVSPYPHPECPERLTSMLAALGKTGILDRLERVAARPASVDDLAMAHDRAYVERTLEAIDGRFGFLDPDTYFSPDSKEAALLAAGGTMDLAKAVWDKDLEFGLALPRPPGHHATKTQSMGFCIFNNIAIATAGLLRNGAERILIFDWDVHHGNGTQDIFYDDPRVLFISVHQWPHYPGSGLANEIGRGAGRGFTANVPLPAGAGDAEYADVANRILLPLARCFNPEMVLVSAGFDPYENDMLAGMDLSVEGFGMLAGKVKEAAGPTGRGPCLVLEGGYHLQGISQALACVASVFEGASPASAPDKPKSDCVRTVDSLITALKPFWPDLGKAS